MDLNSTILGFSIFGMIVVGMIGGIVLFLTGYLSISKIVSFFTLPFYSIKDLFMNNDPIPLSDVCSLFPSMKSHSSRVPSIYMAHIAFFFGFIFTNAYSIYVLPTDNSISTLVKNRKSRALMSMILIGILYLIISILRLTITGCESLLGLVVATTVFGALGYSWYKFAEYCGARNADIFGISSSFISSDINNTQTQPLVCNKSS